MSSQVIADNQDMYRAHEGNTLLSEVVASVCVLLPHAFVVAGFGAEGKVLAIRNITGRPGLAEWDSRFFEHDFVNEPLLAIPSQLKAIFMAGEHTLAIPDALYDADALSLWMKSVHHFPPGTILDTYSAVTDQLHYAFTMPPRIQEIIGRYFADARILPLAAYQLHRPAMRREPVMQCAIGDKLVTATLRVGGKLIWHQVFPFTVAEDIAWQFTHLCKSHQIHAIDLNVEAALLSEKDFNLIAELETFFPKIKWTAHQTEHLGNWAAVVYLMQQLYACVS